MNSTLRPDERAAQAEIERAQKGKNLLTSAAGATAGAAGASQILPFLNKHVPMDLAIKGISKVAPKIGALLKQGQSLGLSAQSGLDYLKGEAEKSSQPAKQNGNIIEQESPELHQFIDQEIRKGRQPIEAGALAQNDKRFSDIIKKLMKAHKTPWSSIIESIYGTGQTAMPNQQQQQPTNGSLSPSGVPLGNQPMQQQPQQAGQGGPGSQKLMGILNQINQQFGKQ
jgi:hypothetical protein